MNKITILLSITFLLCSCNNRKDKQISAPGVIDGDIVVLKSLVSGELIKIPITEGDTVQLNTLVAEVDHEKIENNLDKIDIERDIIRNRQESIKNRITLAKSRHKYYKNQFNRYKRLKKKNSVPGENVEKLEVQLTEAETSMKELYTSLERTKIDMKNLNNQKQHLKLILKDHLIKSPINSGIVLEKYLNRGEIVNPGTPIAEILDPGSLYVEVFVEEPELIGLKIGQKASIHPDGIDTSISGKIVMFGKKAEFSPKYIISEKERRNLLFKVKINIPSEGHNLKIGMPVTVEL